MRFYTFIFIFFSLLAQSHSHSFPYPYISDKYITLGPTWNYHFGNGNGFHSFGFQIHYWDISPSSFAIPSSFGLGIEGSSVHGAIYYADVQTGVAWVGTSHGVVYNSELGLGYQGSLWGNFFTGGQYMYRSFGDGYHSPGLYITFPRAAGGYHIHDHDS